MTIVRPRGVIYSDALGHTVEATGAEVIADDKDVHVSSVGWELESASGGAQLLATPRSRHPQPSLPLDVAEGASACWMMTRDEIAGAIGENLFDISVDLDSLTLRPFATANGERVTSSETVRFADISLSISDLRA